jgi:hypothetical protein
MNVKEMDLKELKNEKKTKNKSWILLIFPGQ